MILVSSIFHRKPELIRDQLLLYNAAMGGEGACHHILHLNRESVRHGILDGLGLPPNATVNPVHLETHRPTFLGCHVLNLLHAMREGFGHTHVYLHTESDIPYRPGLGEHIRAHDLGLAEPRPVKLAGSKSAWAEPVANDLRLRAFVERIGDGRILTTRYEGMFATRALMTEILFQMMAAWPFDEHHWRGDYPYEEFALPTVVEAVVRNRTLRRTRHAVMTASSARRYELADRAMLRPEHIPLLEREGPEIFCAKFAPGELHSPVRAWARRCLGVPEPS
ncbi:hypothetical protein [Roseomonas populi]|uniref:Uncharacterized protein n=1 Tax=Roseomonas populi TaxID=3121582 RepID=A0ABT1X226_9PROT|nr:hypothetical protein [Roseomonas pecuniae]MCR0982151.1 hypothetical protein [Roseomonas pecuniae]